MLQCCGVAVLQRCNVPAFGGVFTMLQRYSVAVLRCCGIATLQRSSVQCSVYNVAALQCSSVAVLRYCNAATFQRSVECYSVAVYCSVAVLR